MTATSTIDTVDRPSPDSAARTACPQVGAVVVPCRPAGESVVTLVVVAACVLFVFKELQPSQLFKNTTPAGGDMGAHVWLPDFVKRSLLPHLRITGWTPDWYDGFPALTYYFPRPIVGIALAVLHPPVQHRLQAGRPSSGW